MNQNDDDDDEEEMDPEQGRAFGDVVDRRFEELVVVQRSGAGVDVDRENQEDREKSDGGEYGEASAFDQEELSGVGAAVAGDLATRGVPDGEELGEEGGGTGDPMVVAAELDGEEDDDAADGADGGDVEKVLDVTVPGIDAATTFAVAVAVGGGNWAQAQAHWIHG